MSDSELGRKWDRCLADTVVKMGKRLLAPGGRRPEPGSQLRAPLTWRAEGKLRERSGRPACSSPSGQGQVPEPGREVTRAVGNSGRRRPGGAGREEWSCSPEEVGGLGWQVAQPRARGSKVSLGPHLPHREWSPVRRPRPTPAESKVPSKGGHREHFMTPPGPNVSCCHSRVVT